MFFPTGLYIFESYMNLCPLRLVLLMQLYILTKCIVSPDINIKINAQQLLQYSFSIWKLMFFKLQNSNLLDHLFPTFQLLFRFKIVRSSTDSMAVSFQSIACILYLNAFDTSDKLFDKDKFLFYFFQKGPSFIS